jgi:hypothetical protein
MFGYEGDQALIRALYTTIDSQQDLPSATIFLPYGSAGAHRELVVVDGARRSTTWHDVSKTASGTCEVAGLDFSAVGSLGGTP